MDSSDITDNFDVFKAQNTYKGFVYVLYCKGFFKIGHTSSTVKSRIHNMVTGNPFNIDIVLVLGYDTPGKAKEAERHLHRRYHERRIKGEWFDLKWSDVRIMANAFKDITTQNNINDLDIEEEKFTISFKKVDGIVKNFKIGNKGLFKSPIIRQVVSVKDADLNVLNKETLTWLLVKLKQYQEKLYRTE